MAAGAQESKPPLQAGPVTKQARPSRCSMHRLPTSIYQQQHFATIKKENALFITYTTLHTLKRHSLFIDELLQGADTEG